MLCRCIRCIRLGLFPCKWTDRHTRPVSAVGLARPVNLRTRITYVPARRSPRLFAYAAEIARAKTVNETKTVEKILFRERGPQLVSTSRSCGRFTSGSRNASVNVDQKTKIKNPPDRAKPFGLGNLVVKRPRRDERKLFARKTVKSLFRSERSSRFHSAIVFRSALHH